MEIDHEVQGHKCDYARFDGSSPFLNTEEFGFTHGERIRWLHRVKEAKIVCPGQDKNFDAAIKYHEQFLPTKIKSWHIDHLSAWENFQDVEGN
ncbi:hypothetical protein AJ79_09406 [Helicocarpus griseus UAMH5409]|uniref:Uncharacterized protein n=1 Tax=Helicocarpus griseus UAMH5409 TaxID=1447875 RepID=A0A2B7WK92_9EURO|nr:hypothetical protein AJ79_09406 [Helicocarpus griseus UAMH5409]